MGDGFLAGYFSTGFRWQDRDVPPEGIGLLNRYCAAKGISIGVIMDDMTDGGMVEEFFEFFCDKIVAKKLEDDLFRELCLAIDRKDAVAKKDCRQEAAKEIRRAGDEARDGR